MKAERGVGSGEGGEMRVGWERGISVFEKPEGTLINGMVSSEPIEYSLAGEETLHGGGPLTGVDNLKG